MILANILFLIIFIAILAKSSGYVVNSSIKISEFFGISHLAIGFLLISTATSLPELSVSVVSSSIGEGAISLGNVFGSNIADIFLILGVVAFVYGFKVKKKEFDTILPILIISSIVAFVLLFTSTIENTVGIILLILYVLCAYYILKKKVGVENGNHVSKKEAGKEFIIFFISVLVVIYSSVLIVENASELAEEMDIAKGFIGATIIAIGTSLPELAVDLQAIRKKKYALAIGDAIGSVMTNTTLVLGTAAVIHPIVFDVNIAHVYLLFNIIACTALYYILKSTDWIGKKRGAILVLLYIAYIIALVLTQLKQV